MALYKCKRAIFDDSVAWALYDDLATLLTHLPAYGAKLVSIRVEDDDTVIVELNKELNQSQLKHLGLFSPSVDDLTIEKERTDIYAEDLIATDRKEGRIK
jgi:hypothetical protein